MKKAISLSLVFVMCFSLFIFPTSALSSSELTTQLKNTYGVLIKMDAVYSEAEKVSILENANSYINDIGSALFKDVVSYYKNKGYSITLNFVKAGWESYSGVFSVSGKSGVMKILTVESGVSTVDFDNFTFVHEFGHMIHFALDLKLGSSNVSSKWKSAGTEAYVSDYAQTNIREDFAETFAYIVTNDYTKNLLKDLILEDTTNVLKNKVNQMDALLKNFSSYTSLEKNFGFSLPKPISALPTSSKIYVNGSPVSFDAYTINQNNYFKLRDIAYILSGTNKQFDVTFNPYSFNIVLVENTPYTPVGGEMTLGNGETKTAMLSKSSIFKGVYPALIEAYTISENNYFKLRDLGIIFDFNVSWDGANNAIMIDTNSPYTAD